MSEVSRNSASEGCPEVPANPANRPNFPASPQASGAVRSRAAAVRNLTLIAVASPAHASPVPLILLILGAAVAWVIRLWLWPLARCRRCDGSGNNAGSTGRRWGNCRTCGGTGRRERFGSRLVARLLSRKR